MLKIPARLHQLDSVMQGNLVWLQACIIHTNKWKRSFDLPFQEQNFSYLDYESKWAMCVYVCVCVCVCVVYNYKCVWYVYNLILHKWYIFKNWVYVFSFFTVVKKIGFIIFLFSYKALAWDNYIYLGCGIFIPTVGQI